MDMRWATSATPDTALTYESLLTDLSRLPVSFGYGSTEHRGLGGLPVIDRHRTTSEGKVADRLTLSVDDNLQVVVDLAFYDSHGAYEWTVWFENVGSASTDVIHSLWAADMTFEGERPVVKGILGDHENFYRPYEHDLTEGPRTFTSVNGRPTHIQFPYFNLEHGDGGALLALGWGGTWEAQLTLEADGLTRFRGTGTRGLRTYLEPGERIRTALVAVLPYGVRDEDHATNLWRSWYLTHNLPKKNAAGEALRPFSTTWLAGDTGLPNSDGSISEQHFTWRPSLEKMLSEGIEVDYRWVDAGWYLDPQGRTVESDWWGTIGSWELDRNKWPGTSFRESVDFAHEHAMGTLLWFEPERVTDVEGLVANHGYRTEWALPGPRAINNDLGNDECLQWTLDRIVSVMDENDVDMYREDNNSDPIAAWSSADAAEGPDRVGISENKSVVGHYRLWDGILDYCARTGKDTFVDSCASGGGRNDLESMRRGVPLLRSDYDRTSTALRLSMTTSFNRWIPFNGASTTEQVGQLDPDGKRDPYIFRASYNPIFNINAQWTQDPATDFDMLRWGMEEWHGIKDLLLADFYPLTPWRSQEQNDGWTSYLYLDEARGQGALLAFRMENAEDDALTVGLRMLDPVGEYSLTDADDGTTVQASGADLIEGFTITRAQPRSAALFHLRRVD